MIKSLKILIVEDEILVAEDVATDLTEFGCSIVGVLSSGEECIEKINLLNPDVVVMDIRIQGKYDGIETAKIINQTKRIPVVYLTANSDQQTLNKVLSVFPSLFISKPYNKNDLFLAISVFHQITDTNNEYNVSHVSDAIFIKVVNQYKKIKLEDIIYIEAAGSYSKLITPKETLMVSNNLNYLQLNIKSSKFRRVHRSYIVNINCVDGFDNNKLLIGNSKIPISRQYLKEVMMSFKRL